MAGRVLVEDVRVDKPGYRVDVAAPLRIKGDRCPFVSRAGVKLNGAIDRLGLSVQGLLALDSGISTGGFTDCLLARGVRHVVGVDVGYGQVAERIRSDPRVTLLERTNLRHLTAADLPYAPDLVTLDLSFISLTLVLPVVVALTAAEAQLVVLVKPQFEVGKGRVGKGGIVSDPRLHREVIESVTEKARQQGLGVHGLVDSRPLGADGNREFFLHLVRSGEDRPIDWSSVTDPDALI